MCTVIRKYGKIIEIYFVRLASYVAGLLDFKFLLKGKDDGDLSILEEGANRILQGGAMEGEAGPTAQFKFPTKNGIQLLQFPVSIQADPVSPFALAASWRSLRKNLQSHGSMVMSIPDVIVDGKHPVVSGELENQSHSLELDLEQYEVPTPYSIASSAVQDPLARAAEPTDLHWTASLPPPFYGESRLYRIRGGDTSVPLDRDSVETPKRSGFNDRCVSIKVCAYVICQVFFLNFYISGWFSDFPIHVSRL